MGVLEESIPDSSQGEVFAFLEKMGPFHPADPHWYLPFMGVDPRKHGQGYASAQVPSSPPMWPMAREPQRT